MTAPLQVVMAAPTVKLPMVGGVQVKAATPPALVVATCEVLRARCTSRGEAAGRGRPGQDLLWAMLG